MWVGRGNKHLGGYLFCDVFRGDGRTLVILEVRWIFVLGFCHNLKACL